MAQRRKSLTEKDIRTMLAVIECYQEQNSWNWSKMNVHMGSITIEEMYQLQAKLKKWYHGDVDPEWDY